MHELLRTEPERDLKLNDFSNVCHYQRLGDASGDRNGDVIAIDQGPVRGRHRQAREEVRQICQVCQEDQVWQVVRKYRRQGREVRRRHVEVVQQRFGKNQK